MLLYLRIGALAAKDCEGIGDLAAVETGYDAVMLQAVYSGIYKYVSTCAACMGVLPGKLGNSAFLLDIASW